MPVTEILVIALLIHVFLAQATRVYGQSMEPNLHTDMRLVVEKLSYRLHTPQRGDIVVLNVWASWCAPCRAEAPELQEVWNDVQGRGVQFVGLNTRDSELSAQRFVETMGLTFPSVQDTDGRLQLLFSDSLPPQAIPSTLVIDRDGNVAARILGKASAATLRGVIDEVDSGDARG